MVYDVAVIGAGLAGLSIAQALQAHDRSVVLLDKSRGIGGRVATRRLHEVYLDHGLPHFQDQGPYTRNLIEQYPQTLQPWRGQPGSYASPMGNTAIAKVMAADLSIQRQYCVTEIHLDAQAWTVQGAAMDNPPIQSRALVLAIPAPQAIALLDTLPPSPAQSAIIHRLAQVVFDPCLTVMVGYPLSRQEKLPQRGIMEGEGENLQWVIEDSSKREQPHQLTLCLHSTPTFAQTHEDDWPAGVDLLLADWIAQAGPAFSEPLWVQGHRWRYAFTKTPLGAEMALGTFSLPLICCGDWCLGATAEAALASGQAAGNWLLAWLLAQG